MELVLENKKTITIEFLTLCSNKDTDAELTNTDNGSKIIARNEIVISLINFLESDDKHINLIYKSQSPYWFFHDLAHAIYTPFLFTPKIIEIDFQVETWCYKKGIELARKYGLEENYITSVPELKQVLEPTK